MNTRQFIYNLNNEIRSVLMFICQRFSASFQTAAQATQYSYRSSPLSQPVSQSSEWPAHVHVGPAAGSCWCPASCIRHSRAAQVDQSLTARSSAPSSPLRSLAPRLCSVSSLRHLCALTYQLELQHSGGGASLRTLTLAATDGRSTDQAGRWLCLRLLCRSADRSVRHSRWRRGSRSHRTDRC